MIARFFNTSKPIHSVIVAGYVMIVFLVIRRHHIFDEIQITQIFRELSKFLVILASIFVLDFLVNKNKLTQKNGYDILIYGLLLVMCPVTMTVPNIFISNFFILLAIRRIISIRSNLYVKKKLFDAAFWISIAALFYFWAMLFFILILAAMLYYSISNLKNWVIPFIGVITVVFIVIGFSIITQNAFGELSEYFSIIEFGFEGYEKDFVTILGVIIILSVIAITFYLLNLRNKQKAQRPSFLLVFFSFVIGLVIVLIAPDKNGSELLFTFPALAIIIANYLQAIKKRWLAEVFVYIMVLTPIIVLTL